MNSNFSSPAGPLIDALTEPPRGTEPAAISSMFMNSLALCLGRRISGTFHSRSAFSISNRMRATRSHSRVSISVPEVDDAP
ncbi:hypothetical protein D3C87_1756310 [compost metagenome]